MNILFINRSYWPDAEATGQLLTELCEDLAVAGRAEVGDQSPNGATQEPPEPFSCTVICGQPNANPTGTAYRRSGREQRHGVTIHRVRHTRFAKRRFCGRLSNYLSFLALAAWASLTAPRPDVVVVETDPPLLCLLGAVLRWRFRCRLVVYLQDIYPDVAVALGKLPAGRLTAGLRAVFFRIYRTADRVVVLSDDMRDLLLEADVPAERLCIVPNWVDTRAVVPVKTENAFRQRHRLDGQFVVMYSGNMGLAQRLEDVLTAAGQLRDRRDIQFLLVGDGASRQQLQQQAADARLDNVRFLDYQPKDQLAESLSAADLHLVPLDARVIRYLMPSKIYGILASGTPMLVLAPADCELARIAQLQQVGFVASPDRPAELAERIRWCADQRQLLAAMGSRARELAEARYDRAIATAAFAAALQVRR